jgi:hypothetical protein
MRHKTDKETEIPHTISASGYSVQVQPCMNPFLLPEAVQRRVALKIRSAETLLRQSRSGGVNTHKLIDEFRPRRIDA